MKRRMLLVVAVLFVILLAASIPINCGMETLDFDEIKNYPTLLQEYEELCGDRDLYKIETNESIYVVTLRNIWGSWERYILPCYTVRTPDVSKAGSTDFHAEMHILAPWNEENFFTNLCRLKVTGFSMHVEPGENTFINKMAEFTYPQKTPAAYLVESNFFHTDEAIICDALPTVSVKYRAATNLTTEELGQPVTTTFHYEYSLRMWGKQLFACGRTVSAEHLVNN